MSIVVIKQHGSFEKTTRHLEHASKANFGSLIQECGRRGVEALSAATPVDSGKTASSWSYSVDKTKDGYRINWINDSQNDGISIVILNQYGHATRSGSWVQGRDFINPALRSVVDDLFTNIESEVKD